MIKYQGEDIYFSISFDNSLNTSVNNFNDVFNVVVYAYTNEENIVKFSRIQKTGYYPLSEVSDTILSGVIESKSTLDMVGQLKFDVMFEIASSSGDLSSNIIESVSSRIIIKKTPIRAEIK
jgi:hypothetical protein